MLRLKSMALENVAAIVLAAGKGTRMKSDLPKCAHTVCGLPMAELVLRSLTTAGVSKTAIVVGHGGEALLNSLKSEAEPVWQHEQLGTGHAVQCAKAAFADFDGPVFVVSGDTPLITAASLKAVAEQHRKSKAVATIVSFRTENPIGYGRIIRDSSGDFREIVEEKDATPAQKSVGEVNSGVYCIDSKALFAALTKIKNDNSQGEYYLTDVFKVLIDGGATVGVALFEDGQEFSGVNDRWQLANAEKALRLAILKTHALAGVTIRDIETVLVGPDVTLGIDVVLERGCTILGRSTVGKGATLGPFSMISDSTIGEGCSVLLSHLVRCEIGARTKIGPFANIRPHSRIGEDCKVGNFVEVKNATLEKSVAASHLTYIGDAHIGASTNIGAGTIFCNYDGFEKHRTDVGEGVFVGSNSTLVAPCVIGDRAIVAAGSIVTRDVPADAGAFGRAKTEIKEEWAAQWRQRKRQHLDEKNRELRQKASEETSVSAE